MTQRQFHLPTNDIIFHCLFGTKGQERITKDFLESLLKKEIEDIDLDANLEFIRSYYEDKLQIADVVAKDVNKNRYIIEMQNRKYGYLPQRFLSSACKAYITQLKSSDKYEKLKKIAEYFGVSTQYLLTGDPRYRYLPDIDTFMENLKTPDRIEEKQAHEFLKKFIRLSPKDREEIMRIIDMKIEMSREKENERFA